MNGPGLHTVGVTNPPVEAVESGPVSVKIVDVDSKLKKPTSSWNVDVRPGPNEAINEINFSNSSSGWALGDRALYLTADGGNTWKQLHLPISQDACIVSAYFVNNDTGWVASHLCERDVEGRWDFLRVIQTTDGGQSWRTQYEADHVWPSRLWFADQNNGWLVGSKYRREEPFVAALVLRTIDGGRNWLDVSSGINATIKNEVAAKNLPSYDETEDFVLEPDNSVSVLTVRGNIFKTQDHGASWQKVFRLTDEPQQTALVSLGTYGGKYYIGGGTASIEGVWGIFLQQQSPSSWFRYRLTGISFNNVMMLSDGRVLASGAIPKNKRVDPENQTDGVILYSQDSGRSWQIIYRNPRIRSINSLTSDNAGGIWAAGDRGFIGRLDVPK